MEKTMQLLNSKPQCYLQTIILLSFLHIPAVVRGQGSPFPQARCSSQNGTFTAGSAYGSNVDSLLASVNTTPSNALEEGFFNVSTGQLGSDYAEVLGLCHADLTVDDCRTCLDTSGDQITQYCQDRTLAVLYNENCTIRYSNESIYGTMATNPNYTLSGNINATNPSTHQQVAMQLLTNLQDKAASGGPLQKYSTDQATVGSDIIYGMVQCTPDLSHQQCTDCLTQIIAMMPECCGGKIGGRVFAPSCQLRFETNFRFYGQITTYDPSPPPPPQPPTTVQPPPPGPVSLSTPPGIRETKWIAIFASVSSAVLVTAVSIS